VIPTTAARDQNQIDHLIAESLQCPEDFVQSDDILRAICASRCLAGTIVVFSAMRHPPVFEWSGRSGRKVRHTSYGRVGLGVLEDANDNPQHSEAENVLRRKNLGHSIDSLPAD
jgi:hypothetical protein